MTTEERLALAVDKLRECAAECGECQGTGMTKSWSENIPGQIVSGVYEIAVDCDECADIREVIAACSAPA